jgi:hypothetical protein
LVIFWWCGSRTQGFEALYYGLIPQPYDVDFLAVLEIKPKASCKRSTLSYIPRPLGRFLKHRSTLFFFQGRDQKQGKQKKTKQKKKRKKKRKNSP